MNKNRIILSFVKDKLRSMLLSESSIGELYQSLPTKEYKKLSKFIKSRQEGEYDLSLKLHHIFLELIKKNALSRTNYEYLYFRLFQSKDWNQSLLNTRINLLFNIIKEFILLSKIREKNIYTETLWGEYLIENKLKRTLQIKSSTYKLDVYQDDYPFQKEFYHVRENLFLAYFNAKKNNNKILEESFNQIYAFQNFELVNKIDQYNTLLSYTNKTSITEHIINNINFVIASGITSRIDVIRINAMVLKLNFNGQYDDYIQLKKEFIEKYSLYNLESSLQIFSTILNFGLTHMDNGETNYSKENYEFYTFLDRKNVLESKLFFNQTQLNRYITLILKHGETEEAIDKLENLVGLLPKTQIESCYNLNLAKIEFAKKNYPEAIILLYQINTNLNLLYLPLSKILLLKNFVEIEDSERLKAEKENFYKYFSSSKSLSIERKQRYILFHKYIEQMLSDSYKLMSAYVRKKIDQALEDSSPYFIEKEWMQERWKYLKRNYR